VRSVLTGVYHAQAEYNLGGIMRTNKHQDNGFTLIELLGNFSKSLSIDPYYPYEPTKDWIWYKPADDSQINR